MAWWILLAMPTHPRTTLHPGARLAPDALARGAGLLHDVPALAHEALDLVVQGLENRRLANSV